MTIAPLLLCHICSSWRTFALSIPQLWEKIHLDLGNTKSTFFLFPGLLKDKVDLLEFWTSKAAHRHPSLHLSFNNQSGIWVTEDQDFVPFQQLLSFPSILSARLLDLNHLTHWNIDTLFNPINDSIPNREAYEFPNLETLAFRDGPINPLFPSGGGLMVFKRTPSLRRLAVILFKFPLVSFDEFSFHWKNLTHCIVACYQVYFPKWYEIITSCVSLVYGAFLVDMHNFKRHERTELPNLRQLTVVCMGQISERIFLDLSFPSLTSLRLSIASYSSPLKMQNLLVPIPSLVEFHLQSCIAVHDSSYPLSMFVPNLRIMVIDGFISYESISPLDDINNLLFSPWLTKGWLAGRADRGRIEYIIDPTLTTWKDLTWDRIRGYVARHIASSPEYPFASVIIRDQSETLWDWPIMTAYDLEHRWDEKMKFYERNLSVSSVKI